MKGIVRGLLCASALAAGAHGAELPDCAPPGPPGARTLPVAELGPQIFSHTRQAGPDETFVVFGESLAPKVIAWCPANDGTPAEGRPKVQFCDGRVLAATFPQSANDGVFVAQVEGDKGPSRPFVLNAPRAWWVMPDRAEPAGEIRIFGDNLARRPDFDRAAVFLQPAVGTGRWLDVVEAGKYRLTVRLPADLPDGRYVLWCHAGTGGRWGWSDPLPLTVARCPAARQIETAVPNASALHQAIAAAAQSGGGVIRLPPGVLELDGMLKLPAGVILRGQGRGRTVLRFRPEDATRYLFQPPLGWRFSPRGLGGAGAELEFEVDVPREGQWTVWLRYACDVSRLKKPGLSGCTALTVDDGQPVALDNLPNTGGYEWYVWASQGKLRLTGGKHRLTWRNVQGGGLNIDAFLLALDEKYLPPERTFPQPEKNLIILQAEDSRRLQELTLPERQHVNVWLSGDGAGLVDLSVQGSAMTDTGVLIRHEQFPRWVEDCRLENVAVTGVEGRGEENRTVRLCYAHRAVVSGCELWGRAPLFLSGARQCLVRDNRLVTQTRFGGGAEGAILGRTNILHQCAFENNVIASPPGRQGGSPTVRRMIWVSTGHGSVSENWFAGNRSERPRFGGLGGTDQNVGEMILLEACQRVAYHGPIAGADARSVRLPRTIPPTPEDQLGSVVRSALAHDGKGNETPFWPPDVKDDDGIFEPTIDQYFVTVLEGTGLGQTRRAVARRGEEILLDRPWDCPPGAGDRVLVCTAFHRNLIVDNDVQEGMSGIQLWLSCIENIVADNVVRHQRRQGLPLVAACSTLASSMPTMWNRGLAPCHFNTFEGNLTEDVSAGASINGGGPMDSPFPMALGNVIRHNSLTSSRMEGVLVSGRPQKPDAPATARGTVVELNLIRDAEPAACRIGEGADSVVFRRNIVHFWRPAHPDATRSVLQLDVPCSYAQEHNEHESSYAGKVTPVVEERHTYREEQADKKAKPTKPAAPPKSPTQPTSAKDSSTRPAKG